MKNIATYIVLLIRLIAACAMLAIAVAIPVYFASTDKEAIIAASMDTTTPQKLAYIYIDATKISPACLIAETFNDSNEIIKQAKELYTAYPNQIPTGGNDPFFEIFYSSLNLPNKNNQTMYSLLSIEERRQKLGKFLSESKAPIVKKILSLREINTAILPPTYTSAGAPFEAAILTSAFLSQTEDFSPKFSRNLNECIEKIPNNEEIKIEFEKYCIGLLTIMQNSDWTLTRSLCANFDNFKQVYDFGMLYKSAPNEHYKKTLMTALLMYRNIDPIFNYLNKAPIERWKDFEFAYSNGEGALNFLLTQKKPIYQDSAIIRHTSPNLKPIAKIFAPIVVKHTKAMLALKLFLAILGGAIFIFAVRRLFWEKTDKLLSLAFLRIFLEGTIMALAFFILVEPDAFKIKLEDTPAPELKFSIEKAVKFIGEETMKLDTDTATLAAIGFFLVVQLSVYFFSLTRLASIKKMKAPSSLKLRLLENEDNLFDLGLYIGLAGTVASLVLLTFGVITASLMAGYTSTLFGILFTALLKVVHIRRYKTKLLIDAEHEKSRC